MPFQKGKSGNPRGQKRSKDFASALRIAIKEADKEGGTKLRRVADALVVKAMAGDIPAIREIADRLDGKVPQAVDLDANVSVSHEDALRELE